jgi:hypothetical protein
MLRKKGGGIGRDENRDKKTPGPTGDRELVCPFRRPYEAPPLWLYAFHPV